MGVELILHGFFFFKFAENKEHIYISIISLYFSVLDTSQAKSPLFVGRHLSASFTLLSDTNSESS